jgi:hypothetical protein
MLLYKIKILYAYFQEYIYNYVIFYDSNKLLKNIVLLHKW